MSALEWIEGAAAGMAILVSVSGAFYFVMRSVLRPLEVVIDGVRSELVQVRTTAKEHDAKDDQRFDRLERLARNEEP